MNKIRILLVFLILTNFSFSQGLVEYELTTNATLIKKYNELKGKLRTPFIFDTINLGTDGFLDDFSASSYYPDTNLWLDNNVYINRTFAKSPITLGVATFEGLDETGYPYDFTAGPSTSAIADYLTSKPINLGGTLTDSVYLSFYYQPQGNGNGPESMDSLVLQFKHSVSGWRNIKAIKGTTLATNDSSWTLVMIPITDTAYLKDDFQFRFFNRATISGNTDHWNIDYVYLNDNRSFDDTVYNDVSYVYNGAPLLKNYREMPWRQYKKSELRDSVENLLRYNYTVFSPATTVSYGHVITDDIIPSVLSTFTAASSIGLYPYGNTNTYTACDFGVSCLRRIRIDTAVFAPLFTAPWRYTIKQFIGTSGINPQNDTMVVEQNFYNHFAYDDGTAENSFGLSVLNSQLAEKFTLNVGDSLQYIDIYFNPFVVNASIYSFNLQVWGDGGGSPGPILYTGANAETPDYSQVQHNQFIRYKLDAPLYLGAGVTFYVGFTQNTSQFLYIGVDKNTNSQNKIFYNVTGSWNTSPFVGSLMLHPVFGSASEFITGITDSENDKKELSVFPNPANDRLYINNNSDSNKITFSIIDLLGKTIISERMDADYIDISRLESGVYFIQLSTENKVSTAKFIKVKQ